MTNRADWYVDQSGTAVNPYPQGGRIPPGPLDVGLPQVVWITENGFHELLTKMKKAHIQRLIDNGVLPVCGCEDCR